ncbi:MAG: hypothetical protein K5985_05330 [Lachnospiraceae bacterium]|nr:hypothetical protein [Lachnospiraceae bacterium]
MIREEEDFREIPEDGIIIGLDLNDDLTFVSFCGRRNTEVTTLSASDDEERFGIPTCIGYDRQEDRYVFGAVAAEGEPPRIEKYTNLLSAVLTEDEDEDEEEEIEYLDEGDEEEDAGVIAESEPEDTNTESTAASDRLSRFVTHVVGLASAVGGGAPGAVFIALDHLDRGIISRLDEVFKKLREEIPLVRYVSRQECFFYYTLNQPVELWRQSVLLIHYSDREFLTDRLSINRNSSPQVVRIEEKYFPEMLPFDTDDPEKMDLRLVSLLEKEGMGKVTIHSDSISSVYLSGAYMESDWKRGTLKYLCSGRRVFQGLNLYTKGACYAAREAVDEGFISRNYLLVSTDTLKYNIGLRMISDGAEIIENLVDAGENWYEVSASKEVYLGADREIVLVLKDMGGEGERNVLLRLDGFPERPPRAMRIRLELYMKSARILVARIQDVGFGEIFLSSGMQLREEIGV